MMGQAGQVWFPVNPWRLQATAPFRPVRPVLCGTETECEDRETSFEAFEPRGVSFEDDYREAIGRTRNRVFTQRHLAALRRKRNGLPNSPPNWLTRTGDTFIDWSKLP